MYAIFTMGDLVCPRFTVNAEETIKYFELNGYDFELNYYDTIQEAAKALYPEEVERTIYYLREHLFTSKSLCN